jgi:hypothetical protein
LTLRGPCFEERVVPLDAVAEAVGIVKKCSFTIFCTYSRAEFLHLGLYSLDQRTRSIMVHTGMPAKYIAMAALLLAECSLMSATVKPRISKPIAVVACWRCWRSSVPVKRWILLFGSRKVLTVILVDMFGYLINMKMIDDKIFTGHKSLSLDLC